MTNVEEIKNKLPINDVVGSYTKLEKAGLNFKARCPFHNEKTPSFFVSPDRGTYYCFGCGAKGDIFSFVEHFEGLDFKGALKVLADRAGVRLESFSQGTEDSKDRLYKVLEEATVFFESKLEGHEDANKYLENRGLKKKTTKQMRLGFALGEWRTLRAYLLSKKYSDREMLDAGLIKKGEKGVDPYYDVFRGRIMFPISDTSGRVVAFSGRILKDEPNAPKYLNSPETKLYNKSKTLYGLDVAKYSIRKSDYAILVEGQMDLVMSHQAGFINTVAVSGTAFSDETTPLGSSLGALGVSGIGLLRRLSKNIIIAFDSDDAGYKATLRAAKEALRLGMEVKVALISGAKDPADIIKSNPVEWADIIRSAKPIIEYILKRIRETESSDKKIVSRVRSEILPYIAYHENTLEQSRLIEYLSYETGMRSDALWAEVSKVDVPSTDEEKISELNRKSPYSRLDDIERKIFAVVLARGDAEANNHKDKLSPKDESLCDVLGKDIIEKYNSFSRTEKDALSMEYEILYPHDISEKELDELVINLKIERLKKRRELVARELRKAERDKDKGRSERLLLEYERLSKELTN